MEEDLLIVECSILVSNPWTKQRALGVKGEKVL